jgi:hypothetical protein
MKALKICMEIMHLMENDKQAEFQWKNSLCSHTSYPEITIEKPLIQEYPKEFKIQIISEIPKTITKTEKHKQEDKEEVWYDENDKITCLSLKKKEEPIVESKVIVNDEVKKEPKVKKGKPKTVMEEHKKLNQIETKKEARKIEIKEKEEKLEACKVFRKKVYRNELVKLNEYEAQDKLCNSKISSSPR